MKKESASELGSDIQLKIYDGERGEECMVLYTGRYVS